METYLLRLKEQPGLLTLPEESVKLPAVVRQDMKQSRALCAQTRQVVQSSQLFLARLLREHSQRQRGLREKLREVVSSYQKTVARPVRSLLIYSQS
jgi:hypothetical protein